MNERNKYNDQLKRDGDETGPPLWRGALKCTLVVRKGVEGERVVSLCAHKHSALTLVVMHVSIPREVELDGFLMTWWRSRQHRHPTALRFWVPLPRWATGWSLHVLPVFSPGSAFHPSSKSGQVVTKKSVCKILCVGIVYTRNSAPEKVKPEVEHFILSLREVS